jgi:hypothetical protein
MTDVEREKFFVAKKEAIINELVGSAIYPITPEHTVEFIDKNWYKNKSFHDSPRLLNPMNADTKGIREYQEQLRENGGYIYTEMKKSLGDEPPVVK